MTLIEILVVLGVIGMILGMGVPALLQYGKGARLKAATRQVMGLMTLARSLAIGSRQDHAVLIDLEQHEVRVINQVTGEALEHVAHLPSALSVELQTGGEPAADSQIVFRSNGSLAGRTVSIVLGDDQKSQTILVTAATGFVSIQ